MNYLVEHNEWSIISQFRLEEKLENKVYSFEVGAFGRMFLKEHNELSIPSPLYDVDRDFRNLVFNSFNNNQGNMGVLLSGVKGSGKTVCAKLICKEANLPIILIDKPIDADVDFISMLKKINQDFILFVDEFEKNFAYIKSNDNNFKTQETFLSIMDGVGNKNKILFLFTANTDVNEYLLNRPSRIKYLKTYTGISEELTSVIVEDLLKNKEFKEDLLSNISLNDCSVDILISIIKEINVHNIPYSKFKKVFNYVIPTLDYEFLKLVEDKYVFLGIVSNVSLPHRDNGFVYVNDDIQDTTAEKDEEGLYPYFGSSFKLLKTSEDTRYLKQGENYFKLQTTRSNIINYVF